MFKMLTTGCGFRQISLIEELPREDGLWKTVLCFIRLNMKLEWFSLRGIRYDDDILTTVPMPFGNTIYGPPPPGDSDSSDDDDNILDTYSRSSSDSSETENGIDQQTSTEDPDEDTHSTTSTADHEADNAENDSDSSDSDSTVLVLPPGADQEDSTVDGHEENEDIMSDLDETHLSVQPSDTNNMTTVKYKAADTLCYCESGFAFENLGCDNGNYVTKPQWKKWELWAGKRRCQVGHDPSPEATQD